MTNAVVCAKSAKDIRSRSLYCILRLSCAQSALNGPNKEKTWRSINMSKRGSKGQKQVERAFLRENVRKVKLVRKLPYEVAHKYEWRGYYGSLREEVEKFRETFGRLPQVVVIQDLTSENQALTMGPLARISTKTKERTSSWEKSNGVVVGQRLNGRQKRKP